MGSLRPALLAVVAGLLVLWTLFPPAVGQNPSGHMVVTTDYELFGRSDLNGGGHVTWTLTGGKAAGLRVGILHMFVEYQANPTRFLFTHAMNTGDKYGGVIYVHGVQE